MAHESQKQIQRIRRHKKVRAQIAGASSSPRLNIFRSNRYLYAQVIDDTARRTLVGMRSDSVKKKKGERPQAHARSFGKEFAARARDCHIQRVVFDRGGYRYHGRVRAFADGAREGGLVF